LLDNLSLSVSAPQNTNGIVISVHLTRKGKQKRQKEGPIGISNAGICTQAVGTVSIDQSV
jgi:hypothetical protein